MLNREQGVTIILVTHEADIAAYADRVITMRDGKIMSDERSEAGADRARRQRRRGRGAGSASATRPAPAACRQRERRRWAFGCR